MDTTDGFYRNSSLDEPFVDSPIRDNWYQSSSYFLSSFALITTLAEDGATSIGPYQLTLPFEVANDYTFMVISRPSSNTVAHIRHRKKCALNFVEFNPDWLRTIVDFGYPGQAPVDKMQYNCFTLIDSPTPGRQAADGCPQIIKEAFQVYECTWSEEREFEKKALDRSTSAHLLLRIDRILLKESWKINLEDGGERMPCMPISYGFRGGRKFWFAEPKPAFWLPVPTDKGAQHDTVLYEANRLDDEVRFTAAAARQLTGVPKVFLRTVLLGIIKQAKDAGIRQIDQDFVLKVQNERGA